MLTQRVSLKEEGNVRIMVPRGEFVGGKETDELRDALQSEAERGTTRLLVDLENTRYLNSSALGVLIAAHSNFSKRDGVMGLCNLSEGIENIFVITKLSLVFNVYQTREEGIRELSTAGE